MKLDLKLEGVLFFKATPLKKEALSTLFNVTAEELNDGIKVLQERLASGATRLIVTEAEVELVTAPQLDSVIEEIRRDEMKRDIGKAGAETLAIILYKGPISRVAIDRIRGVNSSYIIRNLLVRGLVEKNTTNKQITFAPTPSLLGHLGVKERTEIEDFANVMNALEVFENEQQTAS